MSSSKSSASFLVLAALTVVVSSMVLDLMLPGINKARHSFERSLMTHGDGHSGLATAAWYELAKSIAPNDPAPAIQLAKVQWQAGSREAAAAGLGRYKASEALVLRGQYLVQLERYDEAERLLRPLRGYVGGGDIDANYWLGVSLAEQGKLNEALAIFGSHPANMMFEPSIQYILLQQELGIGPANPRFANPEIAAAEYAKQGMIRSAQRVLEKNHVNSASSWVLRAQLDQALIKVNWQEVEGDYEQALAADPSNTAVIAELQSVATKNKDTSELQKLDQLQQMLPSTK